MAVIRRAGEDGFATDLLRLRASAGLAVAGEPGLPERTRRAVGVARATGAPLMEVLDASLEAQDDLREAERAVAVASAQARTVATGLMVAPLLLLPGLGRLVGADLVAFYRSGTGMLVLAAGGALLLCGMALIATLIRRVGRARDRAAPSGTAAAVLAVVVGWAVAGPVVALPLGVAAYLVASRRRRTVHIAGADEIADLVAVALSGGCGPAAALRLVADELPAEAARLRRLALRIDLGDATTGAVGDIDGHGPPQRDAPAIGSPRPRGPHASDPIDRIAAVISTASRLGAPMTASLRRLAVQLRADEQARVLSAAERLPAQLTFPTALCLLPATVLLIGAPIVHTGLGAVGT